LANINQFYFAHKTFWGEALLANHQADVRGPQVGNCCLIVLDFISCRRKCVYAIR